jgi:hypothetical protein
LGKIHQDVNVAVLPSNHKPEEILAYAGIAIEELKRE